MAEFKQLSEMVWASPQIMAADLTCAAAQGFTLIINNRPDGETDDQPGGSEIEHAAAQHGLAYVAVPAGHTGFSQTMIDGMAQALENAEGKVLAYCRSGTRSTFLWALAEASRGESPTALINAARGAGYDISPIEPMLEMLAAKARV